MSTNLSGNALTLNNTSLTKDTLDLVKSYYYVPDNCKAGDTVILDGIECLCVATGVTIQDSNLTRIAVDKNHDLGYYQKYVGINQNNIVIKYINRWLWGGYGTEVGGTSVEVGYGLQNTINCLAKVVNYTKGTYPTNNYDGYPWLWQGVNDFRSSHSDKWFVPSYYELGNYVRLYASSLTFDTTTGGSYSDSFISSSEHGSEYYEASAFDPNTHPSLGNKGMAIMSVRLCRAF